MQICIRGRHLFFSVANWKYCRPSFDLLRNVDQDQDCFSYFWIPVRARWKINFGPKVHRTWKNRHLVLIWFYPSSSTSIPVAQNFRTSSSVPPDWISDLVRKNLVGSAEELEWNRRNCAGIRTEPGCLFLHVPNTLAPIFLFYLPLLGAKSHLNEDRP